MFFFRNKLGKSSNSNVREIHKSAAPDNVQYDQFSTTREALKQILFSDEIHLIEKVTTQILVIKLIWEKVDDKLINQ